MAAGCHECYPPVMQMTGPGAPPTPPDAGQSPPGVDPVKLPSRRPLGGLLNLALVVLALAVGAVLVWILLGSSDRVVVPELVGLDVPAALAEAEAAELTLLTDQGLPLASGDEAQTAEEAIADSLYVVSQDPPAGTQLESGDAVRVALALRAEEVTVPVVVGLTTEEARAALEEAGLQPGALRVDDGTDAPEGTVTRQVPQADALVPRGRSVELWIASAASVKVPDVAGLTATEAEAAAARAGMTLEVLSEVTDEVLPGLVFKQSPRAGSNAAAGSQLVVVVNGAGRSASGTATTDDDGRQVAGDATGAAGAETAVPPPFAALAAAFPFDVLYPAPPPPDLALEPAADNPRRLEDQQGDLAFEVRYVGVGRPEVRLALLQGGHFELGTDEATTVDVRGFPASLGTTDGTVVLSWQEGGTPYLIVADGLEEAEVVAFAGGLQPVPQP